ncbi:OmpA family protein [Salipiger mucosus]|uniref:OmpA/MotB domain protein n=1 Tax=Salipiger mucosus DSM 16094 TaxID=1123237 RepID=S9QEH8_9RHOB|nr:OmpA family protein [Salipiger mucosus]EPX77978.1 OmpA/MotB domain protein [Salipiger mucosus DSM 16094]
MTFSKKLLVVGILATAMSGCMREYPKQTTEIDNISAAEITRLDASMHVDEADGTSLVHYNPLLRGERTVIEFESAVHELSYDHRKQLDAFLSEAEQYTDYAVVVRGHTNEVGKIEDNTPLAEKRTKAVATYLISQHVQPARITSESYSEREPAVFGDTEYGLERNRRVEVQLTNVVQ